MVNGAAPYFYVCTLQLGEAPFTLYLLPFTDLK